MDVLGDAQETLDELGVYREQRVAGDRRRHDGGLRSLPLRGAITFKSTVGTNVASDALANLASGGVTGGCVVIPGRQRRRRLLDHAGAVPRLRHEVADVAARSSPQHRGDRERRREGLELSEASNTPVFLLLRLRACHMTGSFLAKDNVRPAMTVKEVVENPVRLVDRIVLPPASFLHEREKIEQRWPAAVRYITENGLNEVIAGDAADVGIIVQGGMYNTLNRSLELLGLSDAFGNSKLPLYVMNVAYPVIDSEVLDFCAGKKAVFLVEEGQPDFLEQNIRAILHKEGSTVPFHGKDLLAMYGDYLRRRDPRPGQVPRNVRSRAGVEHPTPARPGRPRLPVRPRVDPTVVQPAPAGTVYRVPGASRLLQRGEVGRGQRHRRTPGEADHRLPPVQHQRPLPPRCDHHGVRARLGRGRGAQQRRRRPPDRRDHGRRRLLAQRPHQRHRQRGVQRDRPDGRRGGQQLRRRDRRPGPVVVQFDLHPLDQHPIETAVRGVGVSWAKTVRRR